MNSVTNRNKKTMKKAACDIATGGFFCLVLLALPALGIVKG